VVFAHIPGEATGVAGGFFFGTLPTVLYSTIGLTLGSIVAFVASRIMGLPLVKLMAKQETIDEFRFVTAPRGTMAVLVLFMIPGFPKDILSYLLGLSPMKFRNFVVVCGLGRIPGTLMLAVAGSSLYKENWYLLAAVSLVCIVCLTVLYFRGERIKAWIKEKT
jgi:uncharacterized membrane protein YdjX (TVP38/TMEM64 family)